MKIRSGFVSNSSSSSFVLVTSVENHERAMSELNEKEQKFINAMMFPGGVVFGRKVMVGEEISSENWYTLSEVAREIGMEDEDDASWETWEKYQKLLKEKKEEVFSYSMDF
jgi:hypothetical protein